MSTGLLDPVVARAIEIFRELGVDGEAYAEDGRRVKVAVADGRVERVEDRHDLGVGMRVFETGRVGFAFTTDLSAESLRATAMLAREIARHAGRDEAWSLPRPEPVAPLPFPNHDPVVAKTTVAKRIEMARAIEEAAFQHDPRVRKAREAAVVDHDGRVLLGNTEGMIVGYRYSRALAYVDVAAEESGASQVGHHAEFSLSPAGLDPSAIGKEAARKATAKLGSRPARTGRGPAVIHREVVMGLVDAIGPIFSARRVLKGTSLLANRVGEKVASTALSLVDDPRLPGGYGSAPADGEGLPTQRTKLLEAGVLRGFLHDSFSARKMHHAVAGNSIRSSYNSPPQIAAMNPLLLPGTDSLEALFARAGDGVHVTEVMGLHTIDPISGDFSLGGYGQVIRSGRLVGPVDRFAISGNLLDLLASVEAVGGDLWLSPGGGGAPSLLVGGLSIAGAL